MVGRVHALPVLQAPHAERSLIISIHQIRNSGHNEQCKPQTALMGTKSENESASNMELPTRSVREKDCYRSWKQPFACHSKSNTLFLLLSLSPPLSRLTFSCVPVSPPFPGIKAQSIPLFVGFRSWSHSHLGIRKWVKQERTLFLSLIRGCSASQRKTSTTSATTFSVWTKGISSIVVTSTSNL